MRIDQANTIANMDSSLTSTRHNFTAKNGNTNYPGKPVTETLTNGFFTVNQKWIVKYWNKSAEKLLGVEAKDIVGKNLWEKFAGIIPLEFYTVYDKAFLKDIPVHFEEYWGEMGSWFDVITYYCDDTLSVSFKSSNQPHAEYPANPVQRLKTLTELYRLVTEITNDCLWEWDLGNKEFFWIDGGHKRVLGYPIENALIPQSFWEHSIHPDDKERILNRLDKILKEGSVILWEDEYRFQKADGDYAFVYDRAHIIYDEDKVASRMIGATQDITEKVLLENKLENERRAKLHEITNAVVTAQERERAEIGKELHDNLNQSLAVAKLYVQMAQNSEKYRNIHLEKSNALITNVIEEIRKISKKWSILGTHSIGLFDHIRDLISELSAVHSVKIKLNTNGISEKDIDQELALPVFRIVQEQLNNILKHSNASRATINLNMDQQEMVLLISDNGNGCNIITTNKGVGLINIKTRAEMYNGIVTISSEPGKGFELRVVFPLNSEPLTTIDSKS